MNTSRLQSSDIKTTVLERGVTVLSQNIPGMHTVTVGIWVKNGAAAEQYEEHGIAHFIEHLLFKGTSRRSARQITREIDSLGAVLNAFTSYEYVCYYAKCLSGVLTPVMDVLTDIVLHATFPAEEVERERGVVLQEIHMRDDSPDDALHDQLHTAFWGSSHPLGHHILGSEEHIQRLNRDAIMAYRYRLYRPEDIMVVAAGAVDHDALVTMVAAPFLQADLTDQPRDEAVMCGKKTSFNRQTHIIEREIGQSLLGIATHGCAAASDDRFTLLLLNAVLGGGMSSRLFEQIREKRGLAYSVYSYASSFRQGGMFAVYAGTAPSHLMESAGIMVEEMQRLTSEAVPEDELHGAKEQVKGKILMSLESSDSYMSRLARSYLYFGCAMPISSVLDGIDAVEGGELQSLAQQLFEPTRYTITALGAVDDATRSYLRSLGTV